MTFKIIYRTKNLKGSSYFLHKSNTIQENRAQYIPQVQFPNNYPDV